MSKSFGVENMTRKWLLCGDNEAGVGNCAALEDFASSRQAAKPHIDQGAEWLFGPYCRYCKGHHVSKRSQYVFHRTDLPNPNSVVIPPNGIVRYPGRGDVSNA
jgi:hypothetical protein